MGGRTTCQLGAASPKRSTANDRGTDTFRLRWKAVEARRFPIGGDGGRGPPSEYGAAPGRDLRFSEAAQVSPGARKNSPALFGAGPGMRP